MKIRIDHDEMYPVFFLTEDEKFGKEIEVDYEKARRFIMLQQCYDEMQKELSHLCGYKEAWE